MNDRADLPELEQEEGAEEEKKEEVDLKDDQKQEEEPAQPEEKRVNIVRKGGPVIEQAKFLIKKLLSTAVIRKQFS